MSLCLTIKFTLNLYIFSLVFLTANSLISQAEIEIFMFLRASSIEVIPDPVPISKNLSNGLTTSNT